MAPFKLNPRPDIGGTAVSGREYFESAARELGISKLDSASAPLGGEEAKLKPGRRESRVGGRIARNLKHLSPEETADRRRRSERFLKQPDMSFPAEENQQAPDKSKQ